MTPALPSRRYRERADATLPDTATLLAMGGDARIALDPASGTNRYGCRPQPDNELTAFGSSTASAISTAGFAAADRLRQRLADDLRTQDEAGIYARELNRVRRELLALCKLEEMDGLECVFAASGTDIHLLAAQLAAGASGEAPFVVMAEATETGSGVPTALAGRHFSSRSALGSEVEAGASLEPDAHAEIDSVALRHSDGSARTAAELDAEFSARVEAAAGRRVLLVVTDMSKTGLIAPSPDCAAALRERYGERIEVLVDACQFRLTPASLRGYLEQGFMVALTGSKFVGGPSFSGALLIPAVSARRFRWRPLSPALADYSSSAEWPGSWASANVLGDAANFGLLLRWEAALEELRRFRTVPEAEIAGFLQRFAAAVQQHLREHPLLEPLPVPALERGSLAAGWDQVQTIFPFLLYRSAGTQPLDMAQGREVYRRLQQSVPRYQLGQPVACGEYAALRLCMSARLVVEALRNDGEAAVIDRALAALDRAAAIAAQLSAGSCELNE